MGSAAMGTSRKASGTERTVGASWIKRSVGTGKHVGSAGTRKAMGTAVLSAGI